MITRKMETGDKFRCCDYKASDVQRRVTEASQPDGKSFWRAICHGLMWVHAGLSALARAGEIGTNLEVERSD